MRPLIVLCVALMFPALAAAQCKCSQGGVCTCKVCDCPNCGCAKCLGKWNLAWHPLSNHPGHTGLFHGDEQVGVMTPWGDYHPRQAPGKFGAKCDPPVTFAPVPMFAPLAVYTGGGWAAAPCGH